MSVERSIKLVSYHSAGPKEQRAGLLGWLSVEVGTTFVIDGITLRRTREGRHTLAYPSRADARGRRHAIVRPRDDEARREIEARVLQELGLSGQSEGRP